MTERTREEVVQRSRYSLTVMALLVLILLGAGLPLPQRGVAIVPILVVTVVTFRELHRLRIEEAPPLSRLGPFLTLGFVGMLLLGAASTIAFYAPLKAYEDCMAGANTQAAQVACAQERQQSVIGNIFEL